MKKEKDKIKKIDVDPKEFGLLKKRVEELQDYLSSCSIERSIGPLEDKILDIQRGLLSQQLESARLR